jgi:hypothetical protein
MSEATEDLSTISAMMKGEPGSKLLGELIAYGELTLTAQPAI